MKDIGYGKNYKYAHQYEDNFTDLEFMPDEISGTTLFIPGENARELDLKKWLQKRWKDKYNY
jgi:putative ATPase